MRDDLTEKEERKREEEEEEKEEKREVRKRLNAERSCRMASRWDLSARL